MFPWNALVKTRLLAVAVSFAIAVSGFIGHSLGKASGDREVAAMYRAGQKVVEKRDAKNAHLQELSREDALRIADLSRGARVRCRAVVVPGPNPSPPRDDRETGEAAEDATDLLRQCLRSFGEINRALRVNP